MFAVVGEFHSAVGFKVICATLEMMNFSNLYFQTEVIMCCCVSDPLLRRYVAAPTLSPREQRLFPQPVFQGRKELWPGAKGPSPGPMDRPLCKGSSLDCRPSAGTRALSPNALLHGQQARHGTS